MTNLSLNLGFGQKGKLEKDGPTWVAVKWAGWENCDHLAGKLPGLKFNTPRLFENNQSSNFGVDFSTAGGKCIL